MNRPALAKTMTYMMLSPYLKYLPAGAWDFIGRFAPDPNLRRLKTVADIMFKSSSEIYRAKKEAYLRGGDEALQGQVGQGKDVMSVLRRSSSFDADPFLMTSGVSSEREYACSQGG